MSGAAHMLQRRFCHFFVGGGGGWRAGGVISDQYLYAVCSFRLTDILMEHDLFFVGCYAL